MPATSSPVKKQRFSKRKRQVEVARLYVTKMSFRQIATEIGCAPSTVTRDIADIQASWVDDQLIYFDRRMAGELTTLNAVELEAWQGWERSKLPTVTRVARTQQRKEGDATAGSVAIVEERTKGNAGDSTFLRVIIDCVAKRMQILALDNPDYLVQIIEARVEAMGDVEDDGDPTSSAVFRIYSVLARTMGIGEISGFGMPGDPGGNDRVGIESDEASG